MINDLKKDSEQRMQKTLESLEQGFAKVRTGRAHPSILNGVMVPYYGSDVPLNQVANVGVEDSRTLIVQPFERNMVSAIDKAIRESDLGLNPITTDSIRVPLAALTEETRRDMQKVARSEAENAKVAIRNIRRDVLGDIKALLKEKEKNYFVLLPQEDTFSFSCAFTVNEPDQLAALPNFSEVESLAKNHWASFWEKGAAVDFSHCTDPRAKELERRVVLSQYLLAIQCAGSTPPQETGLTYNSWFGKYHLEMIWWHQAWQPLWGHSELLSHTLEWYKTVEPIAREVARRQGFDGIRWMKMTDPSGVEAPSSVGSFLIWQQPHFIYLAELLYRSNPDKEVIEKYNHLVQETAKFMYSFATYDELGVRFILKGAIPAQETLNASTTINPPFELSYWHFAMQIAQIWRERAGEKRNLEWDELIDKLSPLAYNEDGLYLAAENAIDTYKDIRFTSDHMAVLGAVGILPMNKLIREDYMKNTLQWIWDNWNWGKTWGWDYPMTAMNATRLGEPEKAVEALLMNKRTNTYLPNGHNYQDPRLRVYLPGNGGLLTAIALMCAGWDGCEIENPGFPKNGKWNVMWEGLSPMP